MDDNTLRIALWSGPRNISTTLMRAFGAREDCFVADEPLYAHYLLATGLAHPGREEILARHDTDWRSVARFLTGPVPGGKRVFYQKHMSKHLLPGMGRSWLDALTHAFLIREPAEMLASYTRVIAAAPTLADTGLPEQVELFERVADRLGRAPPVVDARDVLEDPPTVLARLCAALGLGFSDAMLGWPAGRRATDGAWAPHWYAAVEKSTGFGPPPPIAAAPAALARVLDECRPYYERLAAFRLRAGGA